MVSVDAEDGRVVDLGGEDMGGVGRCLAAEAAAVDVGASDELAHPGSRRQRLKVGDPLLGLRPVMLDGERAQRVKAVALDLQPGVRQSDASHARRGDQP